MEPFFCAAASHAAQEDLIGTAGTSDVYVFIQCPQPWASKAYETAALPLRLRAYMQKQPNVRFLLIEPENVLKNTNRPSELALLIYQKQTTIFNNGYVGKALRLASLDDAVDMLEHYFSGAISGQPITTNDFFVCVHGSRDKCCARFGRPFLKYAAKQRCAAGAEDKLRLWQVSHIGGHRFAPTALHLPSGRWYGRLDDTAFLSILAQLDVVEAHRFDLDAWKRTYRGWGILPPALQILERHLMTDLKGFTNRVAYRIQSVQTDEQTKVTTTQATLSVLSTQGQLTVYQASVTKSPAQPLRLSCEMANPTDSYAYAVTRCYPLTSTGLAA
ncbi:MAG: sucrase ferredoxin [Cyanobacteria bacterium J06626_23]